MQARFRFWMFMLCLGMLFTIWMGGCGEKKNIADDDDSSLDDEADGGADGGADSASDAGDVDINDRVEEILSGLSLEDKLGQMVQAQFADASFNKIRSMCIGSVFNGGEEPVTPNNPENWAAAIDAMQQAALDGCGIPILYGLDAVHGNAKVTGSTVFPHNIGLGAANDADLVERIGRATARECRGAGIHMTFAPAVSVVRDERWGRTYEGFGETPALNAELGAAYVRGLQGMGDLSDPGAVVATAKHYVGDGGTENGENAGTVYLSEKTVRALHLPPYEAAIGEGVAAIMPSYHVWERDGTMYPMTFDDYSILDILKDELGFDGFVISDYDAIPRAAGLSDTSYTEEVVSNAINAGVDMAMIAADNSLSRFVDSALSGAADDIIDEARIDEAARRILRVKVKMGLFDNPFASEELRGEIWSKEHQALAREAVQKSMVLLKNDNDALPLKASETVALAGPYADKMGAQAGGWTVGWQGSARYDEFDIMGETVRAGMEQLGGDNLLWREDADDLGDADKVVAVIGEKPYAEGEGDHGVGAASVYLADQPYYSVLTDAIAGGKQVILVILTGRPLILDDKVLDACDAVAVAWLPGSRGLGVADVLYGDVNFTGKLPHTWPASFEQIPVNVDRQSDEPGVDADEVTPLFPLGSGLTY